MSFWIKNHVLQDEIKTIGDYLTSMYLLMDKTQTKEGVPIKVPKRITKLPYSDDMLKQSITHLSSVDRSMLKAVTNIQIICEGESLAFMGETTGKVFTEDETFCIDYKVLGWVVYRLSKDSLLQNALKLFVRGDRWLYIYDDLKDKQKPVAIITLQYEEEIN